MANEPSRIDFVTSGAGPAVVFVPGSFSTAAAWTPIHRRMGDGYRLIAISLCGYGATEETRSLDDFGMAHEVRVVTEAAARVRGPVHLVGHSLGGVVALASAVAGEVDVASLCLFEMPGPVPFLRELRQDALYREMHDMSRGFEAAEDSGDPQAPRIVIDYWGGDGSFARMHDAMQSYCRQTASTNVLDWRTAFSFSIALEDCRKLRMPALLVRGSRALAPTRAVTEALIATLPNARGAIVDGAGHFVTSTHPDECARLISAFLGEVAPAS